MRRRVGRRAKSFKYRSRNYRTGMRQAFGEFRRPTRKGNRRRAAKHLGMGSLPLIAILAAAYFFIFKKKD
jgi:hypothetical protein